MRWFLSLFLLLGCLAPVHGEVPMPNAGQIAGEYYPVAGGWFYNVRVMEAADTNTTHYIDVEFYTADKTYITTQSLTNAVQLYEQQPGLFHPHSFTFTAPSTARLCRVLVTYEAGLGGPMYIDAIDIAPEKPWGRATAPATTLVPGKWTHLPVTQMREGFSSDVGSPGDVDALMMFHLADGRFYAPQSGMWEFVGVVHANLGAGSPAGAALRVRAGLSWALHQPGIVAPWTPTWDRVFGSTLVAVGAPGDNLGVDGEVISVAGDLASFSYGNNAVTAEVTDRRYIRWGDSVQLMALAHTNAAVNPVTGGSDFTARLVNSF